MFAQDAKRSTICGPHRSSKRPKNLLDIFESSGMSIFELPSAKTFYSLGTHFTNVVMRCLRQNQNSSLASSLIMNFGLPRLTIPNTCAPGIT
jgi:hypothetical protein